MSEPINNPQADYQLTPKQEKKYPWLQVCLIISLMLSPLWLPYLLPVTSNTILVSLCIGIVASLLIMMIALCVILWNAVP